jgi:hypothetical protein
MAQPMATARSGQDERARTRWVTVRRVLGLFDRDDDGRLYVYRWGPFYSLATGRWEWALYPAQETRRFTVRGKGEGSPDQTEDEYELLVARYAIADATGYTMRNGMAWGRCVIDPVMPAEGCPICAQLPEGSSRLVVPHRHETDARGSDG